jgi:hypothetical protein
MMVTDAHQKHSRKKDEKTIDRFFAICDIVPHTDTRINNSKHTK